MEAIWIITLVLICFALYVLGWLACLYCWRETYGRSYFKLYTVGLVLLFFIWPIAIFWFAPIYLVHKILKIEIYGSNPDRKSDYKVA